MKDYNRSITVEDLIRKYELDKLKIDRKTVSVLDDTLTKTDGILRNFVEQTTRDIENIQDQLDGNITSWFYDYDPTLNNEPAVNWTTVALKDEHLGDLFYNNSEGTAFRFVLDNGEYKWNQLTDDVAAQALAIANSAQDTADSKRRVFVVEPTPPYDVGDIWWYNHEIYRCIVAEPEGGSFKSTDWVNDLKYTDDSTATQLVGALRTELQTGYVTKTNFIQSNNSINASVKALRVTTDANNTIYRTQPTPPYKVGDIYISGQNVYDCTTARATGSYVSSDWTLDTELTDYVSQAGLDIFNDAINLEVAKKVGNNEVISKINQTAEQIKINASKVNLTGYVTATNLATGGQTTINGSNITTGTIDASRVNVTNINANNITGGTISGNMINGGTITGTTISGNTIDGGSINLYSTLETPKFTITDNTYPNCNISLSARRLRWYGVNGGLIQLENTISSPIVGLSDNYGYSTSISSISTNTPSLSTGTVVSNSTNGGLTIKAKESYGTTAGDNGVYIEGVGNVTLHAGGYCYARRAEGTASRISTAGGNISSRILKKNIKDFKDYKDAIDLLREMKLYNYEYKYNIADYDKSFGFIIDELEENDKTKKFFNFVDEKAIDNGTKTLDVEGAFENPDDKRIINYKSYDESTLVKYLLVVCKEQQKQIDELKERIDEYDKIR